MGNYEPQQPAPGAHFNTASAARAYLENQFWNGHPKCPHCEAVDDAYLLQRRYREGKRQRTFRVLKCKACGKQFTATTKTGYEGVRRPHKWLAAMALLKAVPLLSQRDLAKRIGVNRKTAANMQRQFLSASGAHE